MPKGKLVSGMMLPWRKVPHKHPRFNDPSYHYKVGQFEGGPLIYAVATTGSTDERGADLQVDVEFAADGQIGSENYRIKEDMEEDELLALASEMTMEILYEKIYDLALSDY